MSFVQNLFAALFHRGMLQRFLHRPFVIWCYEWMFRIFEDIFNQKSGLNCLVQAYIDPLVVVSIAYLWSLRKSHRFQVAFYPRILSSISTTHRSSSYRVAFSPILKRNLLKSKYFLHQFHWKWVLCDRVSLSRLEAVDKFFNDLCLIHYNFSHNFVVGSKSWFTLRLQSLQLPLHKSRLLCFFAFNSCFLQKIPFIWSCGLFEFMYLHLLSFFQFFASQATLMS